MKNTTLNIELDRINKEIIDLIIEEENLKLKLAKVRQKNREARKKESALIKQKNSQ